MSFEFETSSHLASKMFVACGESTLAEAVIHGKEWCSVFKGSWLPSWLSADQLTMGVRKVFPIASALLALLSGASSQTTGRKLGVISLNVVNDIDRFRSRPKEVSQSSFGYNQSLWLVARSGKSVQSSLFHNRD